MSDYEQRVVPPFVKVGKAVRMVDPSSLTDHQKQALWKGIKHDNPALADALVNDSNIAALKQHFNATVRFSVDKFNAYMQTGLKIREEKNNDK
jgi:hypothetical protein